MAAPEHLRGRIDSVGWRNRPGMGVTGPRGRSRSLRRRASAGLRGRLETRAPEEHTTFEYIVKPEVIAIGGRRCGHHRSTTGRDDNAVACRMDRDVRLWVAISVAGSDVLVGDCGRTSKLTNYAHLNIGSPGGPGSWAGSLVSG